MEFTKLSAPSLKDLFVRQIQSKILSGELPTGTGLPPERELAMQMQVSRSVVNAGISELAKQGFLTVSPRIGTTVADYRRSGNIETLLAIMEFQGRMLGPLEISSLLQVRMALEQLGVRLVIQTAPDQQIKDLGHVLDRLSEAQTDAQAAALAYEFHHELMLISGNTILPLLYCSCKEPIVSLWAQFLQQYGLNALLQNMEKLYRLICQRDSAGAALWIDSYLEQSITGSRQLKTGK